MKEKVRAHIHPIFHSTSVAAGIGAIIVATIPLPKFIMKIDTGNVKTFTSAGNEL